jgi:hypothetical protein
MTFHDSHAARLEAWAAGADSFVAKSEITGRLTSIIEDLFRQRRREADEAAAVARGTRPETDEKRKSFAKSTDARKPNKQGPSRDLSD